MVVQFAPAEREMIKVNNAGQNVNNWTKAILLSVEDVALTEFMYLVFTRKPCESYRRRLRSLLLHLCYVFPALINSLVCWYLLPLEDTFSSVTLCYIFSVPNVYQDVYNFLLPPPPQPLPHLPVPIKPDYFCLRTAAHSLVNRVRGMGAVLMLIMMTTMWERETDRHTDRDRERQTQTQTQRDRQRHRGRQSETDRQTETDRDRERLTDRETQTERQRERQTERQTHTETETDRQTDRRGRERKGKR